jgi:hypothetical protein
MDNLKILTKMLDESEIHYEVNSEIDQDRNRYRVVEVKGNSRYNPVLIFDEVGRLLRIEIGINYWDD